MFNLTENTIDALYDAWHNGRDYVEAEGKLFAMYPEGIFSIPLDTVDLNTPETRVFVLRPAANWGNSAE